jgi:hypothetical protein
MRRVLALLAVGIPALAAVTWVGVALARQQDSPLEGWKYAEATQFCNAGGANGAFMVLATTDGMEKVVAFYEKKLGGKKLTADHAGGAAWRIGKEGDVEAFQDNSVQPGAKGEPRPVVVRILAERWGRHPSSVWKRRYSLGILSYRCVARALQM